jgi:capsular polysaccharide biosynthesis protein
MTVTVPLPLNTTADDIALFSPFLKYWIEPLQIMHLNDAFVTFSGLCLDSKGLIKESHHNYPDQLQDYVNDAAYYYNLVEENPDNLLELDDDRTYLLIHHPFYNYCHWICEAIFRAWMVRDNVNELVLLLPDYYGTTDFIMGSLEPFGFKDIFFIPSAKSLLVKNLCMPEIKPLVDSYHYEMIAEVRKFYLDYLKSKGNPKHHLGDKIYLSREKAQRKKVDNEAEVIAVVKKHGFAVLNNEDYTFWEQVSIYSEAKYLISIHGSGLTNMLFMQDGAKILEFHKKKTNDKDWHSFAFWYFAASIRHDYYHQICEPTDINDNYFNANFVVDVKLLEKNIQTMLIPSTNCSSI